tara:strand:- start:414 stop:3602 length:3189 start_codon:yes stop_codon:yes gene_type:complete
MKLTIDEALQQGIAAHKDGKLQDAERLYRAILQSQPAHPDANHNLGVLAVSVNRVDVALPLFKAALEASPRIEQFWLSYIDALFKAGKLDSVKQCLVDAQQAGVSTAKLRAFEDQLEFEQSPTSHIPQQENYNPLRDHQDKLSPAIEFLEVGKYNEAQEWLKKIIEDDSKNAEALSLLSQVLLLDKKEVEAERALAKAVSINSELPSVYRNQARLLLKQSKIEDALRKAQFGYRQSPEDSESLLVLAACLIADQRDFEALPIIEKLLKENSNNAEAYANRAFIKIKAKDIVGAIEDAKMAVSLKPHLTQIWMLLGSLYWQNSNAFDAIEALRIAHKNEPKNSDLMIQLGELLRQNNRANEAITILERATDLAPNDARSWASLGVAFQQEKRMTDAKIAYEKALTLDPKLAAISSNLGAMAKDAEEWELALRCFRQALEIEPQLAEAHSNLGATLKQLGRLDEALESYNQAITLKPDFVEAHSNLGNTLRDLGRLDEAIASHMHAIALKPDYAEAHYNLGNALHGLGRFDEAVASYSQAIALEPENAKAYVNLGMAIKYVKFYSSKPELYPTLIHLLSAGNFTRPSDVAGGIISLLKHDGEIKDSLLKRNFPASLNEAISLIEGLDRVPLLHHLMRVCPIPELQFEGLFVTIRRLLLTNLAKVVASQELIYFLSTLSLHCYINEYVYFEDEEETLLIDKLQTEISLNLAKSEQPEAVEILCLAAYRSLHQYDWCQKLESLDNLEEIHKRLIEEPLREKKIAKDMPVLKEISDDVSLIVREQYEENPYPRWVKLRIELQAKSISAVCDDVDLQLHSENIKNVTAPSILIAGCGTGQHSIGTASRFSNCHVTAVDLSLASLAYAQRKTYELGFTNIDYLQADILHLDDAGKCFDIIESAGTLVCMDEPMAGWRVLVDLLKPEGLMKIGLYSELARQHIIEARDEIASLGLGTSATEIRNFRELSRKSEIHDVKHLSIFSDFFSLSEFRDLVFHVKEHRFTLPQISKCLDELGLKFCGFENTDAILDFRELHGNEADIYDLGLWHQYEERNPQAFAGMYQFWCQKP